MIDAARDLFVEKGYHDTGTEEIVLAAGVGTRGALYHHFTDKQALFEAVFLTVEEELVMAAAQKLTGDADRRRWTCCDAACSASSTPL